MGYLPKLWKLWFLNFENLHAIGYNKIIESSTIINTHLYYTLSMLKRDTSRPAKVF